MVFKLPFLLILYGLYAGIWKINHGINISKNFRIIFLSICVKVLKNVTTWLLL